MEHFDVLIIGAGAAGMAAAYSAGKKGYRHILIADRRDSYGGVLDQCVHNGFGLGYFKEDLTGIHYADRFHELLIPYPLTFMFGTTVLKIKNDRTALLSGAAGAFFVSFDICVLATGCRERTLYSLPVSGTRPAGIMTCGTAQRLINVDGLDIGDDIVIIGTGDVGQIMARQLVQSGKNVITMIEKESAPGGLKRNIENCIRAYSIPLMLNTEVVRISGKKRIEGVTVRNISGEEKYIPCRLLLTAVGMIPETELSDEAFGGEPLPEWFFKVGNCDYVHDIVDSVTLDGLKLWD